MKLPNIYIKGLLSLTLVMAVTTVFSFRSFAATEVLSAVPPALQECGTLTVMGGTVTINGNVAQTGATVMSGSVIATGSDGAVVDLGAAGRVELGEYTSATIYCVGGTVRVTTNCTRTELEVRRGQVEVTSPKTESVAAGNSEEYDGGIEASAPSGVDMKVECERRDVGGGGRWVGPGWVGLLTFIGFGSGIALGIGLGEGDIEPPSSPVAP